MDDYAQLRALLDLAESVGIAVRRRPAGEDPHAAGALVRVGDREMLFLDADSPVADRIAVVAAALAGRPEVEDVFLAPEIRGRIDRAAAEAD